MKSIIISIIQILFLVSPVSASERETDYIVTFYPESGSILQNISCKIVFTAEGIDKKKISITGVIINERGDTVQSVKTLLPGIGYFHIYANPGERYILTYIIHSGFISGYQNRYGDNLKPPTNVYHRMTA